MAPHPTSLVYRLRGLPSHIDSHAQAAKLLSWALEQQQEDLGIQVCSLATITEMPRIVQDYPNQDEWIIEHSRLQGSLLLDSHFRGMTPLHDILPPHEHRYNCIAISGLSSHPFGSWQSRGGRKEFMWLRDEFPRYQPTTRVWIYGYDTSLTDRTSFQSISDLSISLINHLEASDFASPYAPQILVMAHSLGGIVLKEAISRLARGGSRSIHILRLIRGAILFGVPNLGMEQSHLQNLVQHQPNLALIEDLAIESPYLIDLDERFLAHKFNQRMNVMWAYETRTSGIFEMDQDGIIRQSITRKILVSKESATSNLISQHANLTIPINKDHSSIVKYHKDDEDCSRVMLKIGELIDSILDPPAEAPGFLSKPKTSTPFISYLQEQASSSRVSNNSISGEVCFERKIRSMPPAILAASLYVPELLQRHEGIETRSPHTFEWIFENDEVAFTRWLRSDEKLYWIRGKPGSGKSTMMKFVHDDLRTRTLLNDWKSTEEPIIASFFFHHRGSVLQKSLDGLLRNILAQIFQQRPKLANDLNSLIEEVTGIRFPLTSESLRSRLEVQVWRQNALWKMLRHILGQRLDRLDICFFFDALDEYDGSPDVIKDFLSDLQRESDSGLTNLKICFSSRSWESFAQSFSGHPGFAVQDHTIHDIQTYCYQTLDHYDPVAVDAVGSLVPDLAKNAHGVFLWARLALRDLIEEGGNTAEPDALHKKLNSLPRELEDYYEEIVMRCHISLRKDAYALLEIVTRSDEILTLPQVLLTLACSDPPSFEACRSAIESTNIETFDIEEARRRISNACGGLLEVHSFQGTLCVVLMHQTVREFVLGKRFRNTVLSSGARYQHENGHSFLAKVYLTQRGVGLTLSSTIKFLLSISATRTDCIRYHLKKAEMTTGKSQVQFLISFTPGLLRSILQFRESGSLQPTNLPYAHFHFATEAGLHLCLVDMIGQKYLTDDEKDTALTQFLSLIGVSDYFQTADSEESQSILRALDYELEDVFRDALFHNRLDLISRHRIAMDACFRDDRDTAEIACHYPVKNLLAHNLETLTQQPLRIVQIHDHLLSILERFLDKDSDSRINILTPFICGTMICNPPFIKWIVRGKDWNHNGSLAWPTHFIDWAVAFWSTTICDQKSYDMYLSLVHSTTLIFDELTQARCVDRLVLTNKCGCWPRALQNLRTLSQFDTTQALPADLHLSEMLVARLEARYSRPSSSVIVYFRTGNNVVRNHYFTVYEPFRDRDDHGNNSNQIEHPTIASRRVPSLPPIQEGSGLTRLPRRGRITALRKTLKTRMMSIAGPSQGD